RRVLFRSICRGSVSHKKSMGKHLQSLQHLASIRIASTVSPHPHHFSLSLSFSLAFFLSLSVSLTQPHWFTAAPFFTSIHIIDCHTHTHTHTHPHTHCL